MQRRNTSSQVAVLALLRDAGGALSHDMIEARLTMEISRSAIYRILNRFEKDGLVHRVVAGDGRQYFALCEQCDRHEHHDNHPHFRCMGCERVECLPQSIKIDLPSGYQSERLNVTVSGYCGKCSSDPMQNVPSTS